MQGKSQNICLICSSGGHLTEAVKVLSYMPKVEFDLITNGSTFSRFQNVEPRRIFYIADVHRAVYYIVNVFQALYLVSKLRPHLVLTTGSGMAIAFCLLSKMTGAKVICIDTLSAVSRMSKTINFLSKYSDLTIVHWPWLANTSKRILCCRSSL